MELNIFKSKKANDILFIIWAGGAALLSYSLVYALRKPYTAASFDDLYFLGMNYKVAVTSIQILGYLLAKFVGIKLISEMKRENRFKFFIGSVVLAELSLILFGLVPAPYNVGAMFFNGLSLGCMWGVIFSFIEGRRVTDLLASLLGVSIVISSGTSKSVGLFAMNELNIDPFWMPAIVGAVALPLLLLMGYLLSILPHPSKEDIELRAERVALNSKERKSLFRRYSPILVLLFAGNLLLLILRDVKEDFLVDIVDMSNQSSWLFAKIDSIVTIIILGLFAMFTMCRNNLKALIILLGMVTVSCGVMSYISYNYQELALTTVTWLLLQSLSLYIAYLTFQTIFFDRFIACFKVKGNVGFFISIIDFVGYVGTVAFLLSKEFFKINANWFSFYNNIAFFVGIVCVVLFASATFLLVREYQYSVQGKNRGKKKPLFALQLKKI